VTTPTPSYKGHRYPVEIINHCVWLYFRFPLSFREVEELMLERGVVVSYETIRRWCDKFGQAYANEAAGSALTNEAESAHSQARACVNLLCSYLRANRRIDVHNQFEREEAAVRNSFIGVLRVLSSCLACSSFRVRQGIMQSGRSGSEGLFGYLIPYLEPGADFGTVIGGGHTVSERAEVW
jgi:hypothetical protein